ncbi:WYL domain-containing protein [Actinomadura sp. 6N118]|uniref:WYL domain-containing protein n=1 Tax=Actinomadura sp. 6N118 TaxID=3375151 RepID=UPI0037931A93
MIAERLPPAVVVEPLDEHTCLVHVGSDDPEALALQLGRLGADFEVTEPPELVRRLRELAGRYARCTP